MPFNSSIAFTSLSKSGIATTPVQPDLDSPKAGNWDENPSPSKAGMGKKNRCLEAKMIKTRNVYIMFFGGKYHFGKKMYGQSSYMFHVSIPSVRVDRTVVH